MPLPQDIRPVFQDIQDTLEQQVDEPEDADGGSSDGDGQ